MTFLCALFIGLCYSSHSLEPVSIGFTMDGDNCALMMEEFSSVQANQPPISLPSPLLPHVPPLHSLCLVQAMTKWRWAVALAAIQPDSLIGLTECLSGSP